MEEEREKQNFSEEVMQGKANIINLREELNSLLTEFEDLTEMARNLWSLNAGRLYIESFHPLQKKQFSDWNGKFCVLLEKAQNSGAIEEGFIKKYKSYTKEQWENDLFWTQVQNHFEQLDQCSKKISALNVQMWRLTRSQEERNKDYKLAAKITGITVAIPLIIGLIYLIDKYLVTAYKIGTKEDEKASLELVKTTHETELEKHGTSVQRDLYYQAAKIGTKPFFQPLKQQILFVECESDIQRLVAEAKKPETPNENKLELIIEIRARYAIGIEQGRETLIPEGEECRLFEQCITEFYMHGYEKAEPYRDEYLAIFQPISPALAPKV